MYIDIAFLLFFQAQGHDIPNQNKFKRLMYHLNGINLIRYFEDCGWAVLEICFNFVRLKNPQCVCMLNNKYTFQNSNCLQRLRFLSNAYYSI